MNYVQPIRDLEKLEAMKAYFKAKNERSYVMFMTGIHTGLRISDILALKAGDVRDHHIVLREIKTKKQKWVRITPELKRIFNEYAADLKDDEYLFQSRKGSNKPIGRSMAYKELRSAAEQFKLKNIGTHTLRKTFGYHFYQQTKDVALLQEILNHSDPVITLRYIGVNQDAMDTAMSRFKI